MICCIVNGSQFKILKLLLWYQFLRLLAEENSDIPKEAADVELALANSVDAMSSSMETTPDSASKKEKQREYEHACREKFSTPDATVRSKDEENEIPNQSHEEEHAITSIVQETTAQSICVSNGKPLEELIMLSYPRKVTVLYDLLLACLADTPDGDQKSTRRRKGYDARHRVALRLMATWFDVEWIKMVQVYPW